MAEDPEVVDQLRWALYADVLSDTATLDLEEPTRSIDEVEQDMNARNDLQRDMLRRQRIGAARIRIADAARARAAVREALLLPAEVTSGG